MDVYATLGGENLGDPGLQFEEAQRLGSPLDFWQKANSYTCPLGPDAGVAWVLLDRKRLDKLSKNAFHSLKWYVDGKVAADIKSLALFRSVTLDFALAGEKTATRLVELRDKRHQLALFSSINTQYNVRQPAPSATSGTGLYYTGTLNSGSLWTWQTMLDDIWGNLPTTAGTAPTLPYTPDPDPENWRFLGVSAWGALHRVLSKIDCTTSYNPLTDVFSFVRLGVTQTDLAGSLTDLAKRLMYDFDPADDYQLANMPETVRVVFHRQEKYHGIEKDTPNASNWELSPNVTKDHTTGITGALSGSVKVVHDDLPALFDSTGTNTNSAALQTRADEIGGNITNRIDVSEERFSRTYSGIVDTILPGSEISAVIWRDYGDDTGLVTQLVNTPQKLVISTSMENVEQAPLTAIGDNILPPDAARPDYPTWPRLPQVVQVDDGSSSTGADLTANGDGLFPGFVHYWADGGYTTLEAVWIRPTDLATDNNEATVIGLKQDDRFVGRLSGVETSGGSTRPVYLVRSGMGAESEMDTIKIVEITDADGTLFADSHTDDLRQSSDCVFRGRIFTRDADTQDLCDRSDVTDGADIWIRVDHNPWDEDLMYLEEGTRFLARKLSDSYSTGGNDFPLYEAVMNDSRIWGLKAQSDWDAAYNVFIRHYIDGTASNKHSQNITDVNKLWENVIVGGTGADSGLSGQGYGIQLGDEYVPIAMRQRAIEYTADVNDNTGISPEQTTINIDGHVAISHPPNLDIEIGSVVNNPFRLSCLDNTELLIARNYVDDDYDAVAVARSEPILIEILGTDGGVQETELNGTTPLCVWDARIVTQNPTTPGDMCDGGGVAINQEPIWFSHVGIGVGSNGTADPYFISAGQRLLVYDIGKDFTPTGGSARRLYAAPRDSETYWGTAAENWTDGGAGCDWVDVNPAQDCDGTSPTTNVEHKVWLPKVAEKDPNVISGDTVAYRLTVDGDWVCVSDYLDDKIGTVKMWALASGNIPPGWAIMDGSANSSGSGINMTSGASVDGGGFFPRGSSTAGLSGGSADHTHDLDIQVSAAAFADALNLTIEIAPHEVSDLAHSHNLRGGTVVVVQSGTGISLDIPSLSCTVDEPKDGFVDGSSTDSGNPAKINNCPTDIWGPLEHSFSSTVSGGETMSFTEAFANSETDPSEHLPEYKTLIFIERIDNSL